MGEGRIISGDRTISSAELSDSVARAAAGMSSLGIGENDTVAMMLRNDIAFFQASQAAALLGAYATPINWHFTADEAQYIVRDSGAKLVLAHADLIDRVVGDLPDGVSLLGVATPDEIAQAYAIDPANASLPAGLRDWEQWIEEFPARPATEQQSRGSMIYTSGTTGRPKGVRRAPSTPAQMLAAARMALQGFGLPLDGDCRVLMNGPMYHSAPNAYGLYAARTGAYIVLQSRFDPEDLLRLIDAHGISHMHVVPTMFVRLLKLPAEVRARYDVSSLRYVVHGAAPCAPDIKRAMIEWWGPVINEYYGATETGIVVTNNSEQALARPGTVGRAVKGGIVRIYDDDGVALGPGEIGEVYVRLEDLSDFTYHDNDAARAEIEREGLVTVGDLGYLDTDGYLYLCDRKRDMIISGGVNIYPAEIEVVLITMPGVVDCAVFGIPHEEFGEAICAYVEVGPDGSVTEASVREFLRERLAGFKLPRVVELVGDLPREDSGKIFKRKLRAPYWQDAGRQI